MKKLLNILLITLCITTFSTTKSQAQCTLKNDAFQAGESLQYNLYFKYGLIYKNAGWATLKAANAKYSGKSGYKVDMISATTGVVRKMFPMNDTLTSYISKELTPLAHFKRAHEEGDFNSEDIYYTYSNNKVNIRTTRHKNGEFRFDDKLTVNDCTYDMMSVIYFVRALDFKNMKQGTRTRVNFITRKDRENMEIVLNGTEKIKAGDDKTYNCYVLSLVTSDDAFKNKKEAMKIYLSADDNRMPVRIDSSLKFGSMRVILKSYKGNKHPVN